MTSDEIRAAVAAHPTQAAAALALGISQTTVSRVMRGVIEGEIVAKPRLGGVREPRLQRRSRAEVVAVLPDRIAALEMQVADQAAQIEGQAEAIRALTAAVNRFVDRAPLVLEVRPTHQRQADGGQGGRGELRETRGRLRKVVPA